MSIVICSHNGADRLPRALSHLASQRFTKAVRWEVILVDNASTDGTAEEASRYWRENAPVPLRIVSEPRLGLSYARERGFQEAKYEIVSFVDDDNWVCREWVQQVAEIMSSHAQVGACGAASRAVPEVEPPAWFEQFKSNFAVSPDHWMAEDVTDTRGFLWGAGLSVRKVAWEQLVAGGFHFKLTGRRGGNLSSGEDTELCFALALAGWRLRYDSRLHLRHFIAKSRLDWGYLRRWYRGLGASTVWFDGYRLAGLPVPRTLKGRAKETWQGQMLAGAKFLLPRLRGLLGSAFHIREGDGAALALEFQTARWLTLLRARTKYESHIASLRRASWNKSGTGN